MFYAQVTVPKTALSAILVLNLHRNIGRIKGNRWGTLYGEGRLLDDLNIQLGGGTLAGWVCGASYSRSVQWACRLQATTICMFDQ